MMKIRTLKFAACAAVMALALSVTACGDDTAASSDTLIVEGVRDIETGAGEAKEAADDFVEDIEEEGADNASAEEETEELETAEDELDESADNLEEDVEEEIGVAADYETLEDYYNSPDIKKQMDSLAESMNGDGMSAAVEVKGNEFAIVIRYEDSSMIIDGMGEAIDQMMDTVADSFKQTAAQFDKTIGQDGACTVVVRYLDPDGKVLSENSYTAK